MSGGEWRSDWESFTFRDGKTVHVRYGERDGRLVVAEMYIVGDGEITSETLRSISVGRLEAHGGSLAHQRIRQQALPKPEPSLEELRAKSRGRSAPKKRGARRPALSRPMGTANPDDFYRAVATAYTEYAAETRAAAAAIAAEANVPVTTAHRWVREARRRGFLPPGRRGKTG